MSERRRFRFLALHSIEAVIYVGGGEDELTHSPRGIAARDVQPGQVDASVARPGFPDGGERGARAVAILFLAEFLLPTQSHEKDALRGNAAHAVEQARAPYLAVHVSGAKELADLTMRGLVESVRGAGEFSRFEDARDYAPGRLFLRCRDFCAKFHSIPTQAMCEDYPRFASPKSKQHSVSVHHSNRNR